MQFQLGLLLRGLLGHRRMKGPRKTAVAFDHDVDFGHQPDRVGEGDHDLVVVPKPTTRMLYVSHS